MEVGRKNAVRAEWSFSLFFVINSRRAPLKNTEDPSSGKAKRNRDNQTHWLAQFALF